MGTLIIRVIRFDTDPSLLKSLLYESVDVDQAYSAAVASGDQKKLEALVRKAARASGYKVGPVYHGGADGFNQFSFEHIGKNATSEGSGFYFTTDPDVARMFRPDGGRIMSVYLAIGKPLSGLKKTITQEQLKAIINEVDPSGEGYLSNYGDVHYDGYGRILYQAVNDLLKYSKDDAEIASSMVHSGVSVEELYKAVEKVTGKAGIFYKSPGWGENQMIYLATDPRQIKLTDSITKDDAGTIIPLSQRFDRSNPDIRY